MRRVRESLLPWKSNKYYLLVCVCMRSRACVWVAGRVGVCMRIRACSLANTACKVYAPFVTSCVVSRSLPNVSTLSHKRWDFRKTVTEHEMCVLIFSTTFVSNISHSKKNLARYRQKCRNVFMWSTRYSCRILMKLESTKQIYGKKLKCHVSSKSV
jgi:hypothetical protein